LRVLCPGRFGLRHFGTTEPLTVPLLPCVCCPVLAYSITSAVQADPGIDHLLTRTAIGPPDRIGSHGKRSGATVLTAVRRRPTAC